MRNPRPPSRRPGARVIFGTSLAGECPESNPAPRPNQVQPLGPGELAALEARIERLAYGEVLPDDLTETRRIWWDMARQGTRLPAQPGVIVITGGRHG